MPASPVLVTLPVRPPAPGFPGAPEPDGTRLVNDPLIQGARPEARASRYGILIVDDEEAILESLELTLGDDYRVFTAPPARRASRSSSARTSRS